MLMERNRSLQETAIRTNEHWLCLVVVLILAFVFPSPSPAGELTLKEFFKISPDDVNFDNPSQLFSEDFKRWDGSEGSRVDMFEDHKTAKINFGNHKAKLKIGKTKPNGKIMAILDIETSPGYGCQYFFDSAQLIYEKKVLSYFDKYKDFLTMLFVEASFEFPDKRIRFGCFELGSGSNANGRVGFSLGDKETIQKTLPRTMISCERNKMLINGKIYEKGSVAEPDIFFIDHDDKILRYRSGKRYRGEVLRFSDDEIKIKNETNEKKKFSSTFKIDRLTGAYKIEGEDSSDKVMSAFGKPTKVIVSGECKKIENIRKF
jgi:hypothetical protein